MNFRTTYILFGVLVGLALVFLVVLGVTSFNKDETNYVLPSLHNKDNPVREADIDTLIIERNRPAEKKLVFQRDSASGLWRMVEPLALPPARVDSARVSELVREVTDASRDELSDVSGPLSKWGLEPPAGVITLKKGDKQWQFFLGEEVRTEGGQTSVAYVSSSDRKEPMAVRLNMLQTIGRGPNEFRQTQALTDAAGDVQKVNLRDGTHQPLILERVSGTQWKFQQPPWGLAAWGESDPTSLQTARTITGVKALLDILTGFKVEVKNNKEHDFVSEDPRDLDQYGLTGDKLLRIEVERTLHGGPRESKVAQTLLIGKKVDDKGDKVYAMLEDEKHVFKVPVANIDLLMKLLENPSTLRNRDLVAVAENDVDVVSVTTPDGELQFFRSGPSNESPFGFGGDSWRMFRGDRGDSADPASVIALLGALTRKGEIKEFPDPSKADDKALQLDPPVATVSLWEFGIKKPEKPDAEKKDAKPELKDATPTVKLLFGKRENGMVYVKRITKDGTTLVTVPDALLDTVTRPALAYIDKQVPGYSGDVSKVTLERNGETFQLEKDKDKDAWKFIAPEALKDKPANGQTVAQILAVLRSLRADKVLAEKSTPELEQQYGLKSPAIKVTLTTTENDKTEDWTYLFSKEADNTVNAKVSKSDAIFQLSQFFITPLQGELRDTTLFSFDRNNVQTMKIVGWWNKFREVQTLELERKSASQWSVKSSTPAAKVPELDSKKAEDFLNYVLRQRVEKFINLAKGPTPQKMELTDDALDIEITVAGEMKPFTLRVGGETPDMTGWFAKSSVLPDEFFTLAKAADPATDVFAKIRKETPAEYFSPPAK